MNTQCRIGMLFIILGCAICGAAIDVIVTDGLTTLALYLLLIGLTVAVLGGIIVPSSGTGPAIEQLIVIVQRAPIVNRFFDRRKDDSTAGPPS